MGQGKEKHCVRDRSGGRMRELEGPWSQRAHLDVALVHESVVLSRLDHLWHTRHILLLTEGSVIIRRHDSHRAGDCCRRSRARPGVYACMQRDLRSHRAHGGHERGVGQERGEDSSKHSLGKGRNAVRLRTQGRGACGSAVGLDRAPLGLERARPTDGQLCSGGVTVSGMQLL